MKSEIFLMAYTIDKADFIASLIFTNNSTNFQFIWNKINVLYRTGYIVTGWVLSPNIQRVRWWQWDELADVSWTRMNWLI